MSKLHDLIRQYCPNGCDYKTLGEIATDIYRGSGIKRDQLTETGIPCVRYGEIYTTYDIWFDSCISHTDISKIASPKYFSHGDILFAITGEKVEEIAKSCAYVGQEKCLAGGDIVVLKHNQNPKYLSYALSTVTAQEQKSKGKVKNKVVHSSVPAIKEIEVPVPPIPIQEEIVRILDQYTEYENELEIELNKELEMRKKQYEYYRDKLLSLEDYEGEVEELCLKDVGKVCMCKRIMKAQTNSDVENGIPFFKIGTFGKEPDAYISKELFEDYKNKYSYPKKGNVLISAAGTIGRTVIFNGESAYFQDSNIVWIDNDNSKVLDAYLNYIYQTSPWKTSDGGTISRLYNGNIEDAEICIPKDISEQQRIVDLLNKFTTLITDITEGIPAEIKMRHQQYEYYRDKLLTFKRLEGEPA